MLLKPFAFAAFLAVGLQPSAAWSEGAGDFQALYANLRTAMDSRKNVAIRPLLTKDFQSIDIQGNVTDEAAMLAELGKTPADPSRERVTTVKSVRVQGASAQIVQEYESSFRMKSADGAIHQMHVSSRSKDTWVKSGDRWLLQTTETRAMTVERDGAQVTHIDLDNQYG